MILIIANILSLIGNTLFTSSSLVKNKKKILVLQNSNYIVSTIAEILQKAYSATTQEMTAFFRNIVLLFVSEEKKKLKLIVSIFFLVIAVSLGILFNIIFSNNVWYGYLPICATIIYSTFVIIAFMVYTSEKNEEALIKIGLVFNSILWATYGFFIKLYPVIIFNCITLILSIISIARIIFYYRRKKIIEKARELGKINKEEREKEEMKKEMLNEKEDS